MKVENLIHPIWLINPDLKRRDEVTYLHYIQAATKLEVKERSLVNCYLLDASNRVFRITDLTDLGNINKLWRFEFFNPMRRIELQLKQVTDSEILQKVIHLIKTPLHEH